MRSSRGRKRNPTGKRHPLGASPLQNRPRSEDTKQILPLMEYATAVGHTYVISCMIVFMSPLRSNSTFSLFTNNPIRKKMVK